MAETNPVTADQFIEAFLQSSAMLAQYPNMGSPRLALLSGMRGTQAWPVKGFDRHIIYYRLTRAGVLRVVRVLHGATPTDTLRTPE